MRARLLVPARADHAAVGDLERELPGRERECPAGVPPCAQVARQGIRPGDQLAARVVAAALQHLVHLVVGQAGAATDQRAVHVRGAGLAVGPDAQLDADDAAHLARAQAAGVGRELEREHRLDRPGHVDAAGAPRRLRVERTARLDETGDVRDVHPHAMAVAIRLDADRVVEVACRRRVDGDRLEREEIGALAVGSRRARRAARLPQRGLRPLPREAALQQQRTQHVLDVVGRAQPLYDARTAAGPLHDHELARLHRLPGASPERELLALVEERLRDEKAPAALHNARDELWPAFVVDHRSTRDDTACTSSCVFTATSGRTPRPWMSSPLGVR